MQKTERNIGIDILRNLAMFGVVVLHCIGHGGYLESNIAPINILHTICYCAVDVFVCITGYVYVNKKVKIARVAELWITAIFWSVILTVLVGLISGQGVTVKNICLAFFPVIRGVWWFLSAYIVLMACVPFLNKLIVNISKKEHGLLIIIIIVFISLALGAPLFGNNVFDMNKGYSPFWFIFLYIVGAYIKLYQPLGKRNALILYIGCLLITIVGKIVISEVTILVYGESRYEELVLSYISPFVMLQAVGLVSLYSQLRVNSKMIINIVEKISMATLGVYLISDHPQVREVIMSQFITRISGSLDWEIVFKILLYSIIIFVGCIMIDMIRSVVFEKLKCIHQLKNLR